jgi:hypothetical protein
MPQAEEIGKNGNEQCLAMTTHQGYVDTRTRVEKDMLSGLSFSFYYTRGVLYA